MINYISSLKEGVDSIEEVTQLTHDIEMLKSEKFFLNKKIKFHLLWGTHADEVEAFRWFSWVKEIYEKNRNTYENIDFHIVNEAGVKIDEWKRTREDENWEDPNRPWMSSNIKSKLLENIEKDSVSVPYFIDFHNCWWKYSFWFTKDLSREFNVSLAKTLWLDVVIFTDPKLSQLDVIKTVTEEKWGLGMVVEVGSELDIQKKESLRIANKLLDISKNINQDGDELSYIQNINHLWWSIKIFKTTIVLEEEVDDLIKQWYSNDSFQKDNESWKFLKIEKSLDDGKSFIWIVAQDKEIFRWLSWN